MYFPLLYDLLGQVAGLKEADCANAMLEAIGLFAVHDKPRHLHLIRLIIVQKNMLPSFQEALHKKVGTSYKPKKSRMGKYQP